MTKPKYYKDKSSQQDVAWNMISGAIVGCIRDHGPITMNLVTSATKRVYTQLRAEGQLTNVEPLTRTKRRRLDPELHEWILFEMQNVLGG